MYSLRKIFTIVVYTLIILLIGRNLPFLPRFVVLSNPKTYATNLKKETSNLIQNKKGNYGIYFANLKTGETFGISEKERFTGASLHKTPIVATLYYLENQGKIRFDEQITLQEVDIQDYGTGSLRYQKPGSTYSLKTLAKLALKQSDNTAAHILSNKLGEETVQKTINQFGLTQTDMASNQTSVYDMYLLFKKIYTNEITTSAKTQELLGFMQDTDIEDRLPGLLPPGTVVYHKTGDTVGSIHDVGIIRTGDDILFLGVLTSDIGKDEAKTKETIARIAKNTVDFYQKRK
ncbi:MAG: serine hydrolase [Candidatus Levybacteria bacterium]|nr:serine hydrolase [Candidatus Levybacteria bacterium]